MIPMQQVRVGPRPSCPLPSTKVDSSVLRELLALPPRSSSFVCRCKDMDDSPSGLLDKRRSHSEDLSWTILGDSFQSRHLYNLWYNSRTNVSMIDEDNNCTGTCKMTALDLTKSPAEAQEPPPPPPSTIPDDDVFKSVTDRHLRSRRKRYKTDMLIVVMSAMYAKLLVVMGVAFPLSVVISPNIPQILYTGFYLYLYFASIFFLVYAFIIHGKFSTGSMGSLFRRLTASNTPLVPHKNKDVENPLEAKNPSLGVAVDSRNCGSFYLRVGAVAFGIGSMIYSGLEFVQYLEMDSSADCFPLMEAINSCAQMAFTFIQLYFVFINSKMTFHRHERLARIGLMHMVATNLCVWLLAVVEESQHEISHLSHHSTASSPYHHQMHPFPPSQMSNPLTPEQIAEIEEMKRMMLAQEEEAASASLPQQAGYFNPFNITDMIANATMDLNFHGFPPNFSGIPDPTFGFQIPPGYNPPHHRTIRAATLVSTTQCRQSDVFSQLVQDISPFLFPCTIEYSLICAAICYIMWKIIGKRRIRHPSDSIIDMNFRRHQYSVDCSHAIKGLFTGILVLVLAIISVILFFVLINRADYRDLAIQEAYISEMALFVLTTLSVLVAMVQIRSFRYSHHRNVELDNILLIVAQIGVYLFSIFSIIAGHLTKHVVSPLLILSSLGRLVQATAQTIFILDASQRNAQTNKQANRKPGREMVTFLLVCNFAMWIITTLETGRSDSNPVQLHFFGFWGWTIIARISTPLAIFYRFHSTVCLCDIWKKLYKVKEEQL